MTDRLAPSIFAAFFLLSLSCPTTGRGQALGPAQNYNVFILGKDTQSNVDSQGPVAVGGDASFTNYSADSSRPTNTPNALVVGGNLLFQNGTVYGDLHVAGTSSLTGVNVTGTTSHDSPLDFNAASSSLLSQSAYLSSLAATGTASAGSLGLTLTGTNTDLNVFQLTAVQFASANNNGLNVVAPTGSTVLVNVAGAAASLANFQMYVNGSSSETNPEINKVLFNFASASSLSDSNVTLLGSVLAPSAALSFGYNHIDGTLIGASLTGNVEAHDYPFSGKLPPTPVPEPGSFALLTLGVVGFGVFAFRQRSQRAV